MRRISWKASGEHTSCFESHFEFAAVKQNAVPVTLEPLSGLQELEELSIIGTLVNSIAPLMDLMSLEKLELSAGRIPPSEIDRFMQLNPACEVIIKH